MGPTLLQPFWTAPVLSIKNFNEKSLQNETNQQKALTMQKPAPIAVQ